MAVDDGVTTTVRMGANPNSVVVNPAMNKTYMANNGATTVKVIDSSAAITTTANLGANPLR